MHALTLALYRRLTRGLHAREEGMLTLASLFVVVGFLLLIGVLANASMTASRKLETQNAADAAAYSTAVELARGMNAVTAANHLMGELTALVVLIHSFAGDTPDGGNAPSTPAGIQTELTTSYNIAKGIAEDTLVPVLDQAYDEAKQDSKVDGAIYDARMRLKQVLSWAFEVHALVSIITQLQAIPLVGPIFEGVGNGLEANAWIFEAKVYEECLVLDALEDLATNVLQPIKTTLRDAVIPGLYRYSQAMATIGTPAYASQAAGAVGTPNLAECSVYPLLPQLPIHAEPDKLKNPAKSQLVRASTPWIQWWRGPWIDFGKQYLILSRFADFYVQRSNKYTLPIIQKLKDNGVNLYILDGMDPDGAGKTNETWTQKTDDAEKMFTVVAFAHRNAPPVFSSGSVPGGNPLFRQENPDGMACYAQAMFYNANPQKRGSGDANWQPTAGWDTLNWDTFNQPSNGQVVPEYPGPMPNVNGYDTPTPTTPQPRIRLNWQAKLVPTSSSRLGDARNWQLPFTATGKILWRTDVSVSLSRTH